MCIGIGDEIVFIKEERNDLQSPNTKLLEFYFMLISLYQSIS